MTISISNSRPFLGAAAVLALALGLSQAADAATRGRAWSVQGPRGHGFTATSTASYGGGGISNNFTRTYNNGKTATSSASVTRNGNGSVTREASHTGVAGNTQSGSSTVYRTDDGFGRTREFSTSSGASVSQTATYTRGN